MSRTLPRTVALVGALVLLGGAGPCGGDPLLPEPGGEIIVAFGDDLDRWPRDDWDFMDAAVLDEGLELTVAYGGGCRSHELWLLAVDGFQSLPDAGPTPTVSVPLLLAHDAHDDPCDAYLTRTDTFDLRPVRAAFRDGGGHDPARIILRIPAGQGSADTVGVDFFIQ